jgi:hypothetical protein
VYLLFAAHMLLLAKHPYVVQNVLSCYNVCYCVIPAGGLVEPPIVPRFMDALAAAGADAVRVPAYLTSVGLPSPECCAKEAALLQEGYFDAIAFSSTAEVSSTGAREALHMHAMCLSNM